jgi:double-stranded uracil-DNA glycosylase
MADSLRENLDIVFCGTAKGKKSMKDDTYYAGRNNKFYDVLYAAGLTDRKLTAGEDKYLLYLLSRGIGLTDLNQIDSGMDHQISDTNYDIECFKIKIIKFTPKILAFTSMNAAKKYFKTSRIECGEQSYSLNGTKFVVLTSTSGANGRYWKRDGHHWYNLPKLL